MKSKIQYVPEDLIYELAEGKAIYYKGYKEVLKGIKSKEEIMGSSYIQVYIISRIYAFLLKNLNSNFEVFTNEVGLKIAKNTTRAIDIAIFAKSELAKIQKNDRFLEIAPKYVLEIDTKASLEDMDDPLNYYHQKTTELLNFGVEKVYWIFTNSKKILLAEKGPKAWQTFDWDKIQITIDNTSFDLSEIIE